MLSGVSGITLNGEVRTVGPSAFLVFAHGIWTIRYEPLVSGSSCSLFGVGAMLGSTQDTVCVSRMAFGSIYDFLRDWVDSAPEVDSPMLTGDAPVAHLLSLEIWVLFQRASCVFSLICVRIFARVDFVGPSRAGGAGVARSLLRGDSAPGLCQLDRTVVST